MPKNHVGSIIIKCPCGGSSTADKVNAFHVGLIKRALKQSNLRDIDKMEVLHKVKETLKSREVDGMIK